MNIVICNDYADLGRTASDFVASKLKKNPSTVLCLPTGKTPLLMYKILSEKNRKGEIDFSSSTVFDLDEYQGSAEHDEDSFAYYLKTHLLNNVNINKKNILLFNGTLNLELQCRKREEELALHHIDLAVLGIGRNGHIAFNEPGSSFDSITRVVDLTKDTITANNTKHKKAITVGIKTILKANEILLLASGKDKAMIIKKAIEGPVNETIPASSLQEHKHVTFMLDMASASLLSFAKKGNEK